jgi:hypothetical protein
MPCVQVEELQDRTVRGYRLVTVKLLKDLARALAEEEAVVIDRDRSGDDAPPYSLQVCAQSLIARQL